MVGDEWDVDELVLDVDADPWLAAQIAKAPPLTPQRCTRLVDILSSPGAGERYGSRASGASPGAEAS